MQLELNSNSDFLQDTVLVKETQFPPMEESLKLTPPSRFSESVPTLLEVDNQALRTHVDSFLAPSVVITRPVNWNVVPPVGWTNSWSLSEKMLQAFSAIEWPQGKKFVWLKDVYPLDYDSNSPLEGRSVFRRRSFSAPGIVNPPYDPQAESPTSPDLDLGHHVAHLVQCARNGQTELIITVPLRRKSTWFSWLKIQPDVALVHVSGKCSFLLYF